MERTLKRRVLSPIVKGVLTAVCFSVVAVLVFAIIYKFTTFSELTIKVVNQIIKVLSIVFGVSISLKHDKTKGVLKGALVGILYVLLSYVIFSILVASFTFSLSIVYDIIFSILVASFTFSLSIVYDIIFSILVGVICGGFMVSLKKY